MFVLFIPEFFFIFILSVSRFFFAYISHIPAFFFIFALPIPGFFSAFALLILYLFTFFYIYSAFSWNFYFFVYFPHMLDWFVWLVLVFSIFFIISYTLIVSVYINSKKTMVNLVKSKNKKNILIKKVVLYFFALIAI